eukprot:1521691-Ditylum_brightwellii.AAC.1
MHPNPSMCSALSAKCCKAETYQWHDIGLYILLATYSKNNKSTFCLVKYLSPLGSSKELQQQGC